VLHPGSRNDLRRDLPAAAALIVSLNFLQNAS
jgi:hypothetical protein